MNRLPSVTIANTKFSSSYEILVGNDIEELDSGFQNPYNEPEALAACRVGNLSRLAAEISKDPSIVNAVYFSGKTGGDCSLLLMAAHEGHTDIVREMIKQGADINYINARGYTPLSVSALNKHKEIVKILIDSGANPGKKGFPFFSNTAYQLSADKGTKSLIKNAIKNRKIEKVGENTSLIGNSHKIDVKYQYGACK